MATVTKYVTGFNSGKKILETAGLLGRVIRGKKPEDFRTLSDDPDRRIIMLTDPQGLVQISGISHFDVLLTIGWDHDYAVDKINSGYKMKLVVFNEGGPAQLATWDGMAKVVSLAYSDYPEVGKRLTKHLPALKATSFAKMEIDYGCDMSVVDKAGKNDPHFMTLERFLKSANTPENTRAFLYFTVHLRELYKGDGYTYDNNDVRGLPEYMAPNCALTDLEDMQIIDLNPIISTTTSTKKGTKMNKHTNLPIPSFFDPRKADQIWRVPYQERLEQAIAWRVQHNIKPAVTSKKKICVMPIDCQNTFCIPGFELFVGGRSGGGAIDDNVRFAQFIYQYLDILTAIFPTLDTHFLIQIFFVTFWINDKGQHPNANTIMTLEDVKKGVWRVNPAAAAALEQDYTTLQKYALYYVGKLTSDGKYPLMVWGFHAMLGGIGHAMVSTMEEAVFFFNCVRMVQSQPQIKGGNPLSENYSILRPEVLVDHEGRPIAQKNSKFFNILIKHDIVIVSGQAGSHCVPWTLQDLLDEIMAKDKDLAKKVYILTDCTSPVVIPGVFDFTDQMNEKFDLFKSKGMNLVESTTPMEDWPGINL